MKRPNEEDNDSQASKRHRNVDEEASEGEEGAYEGGGDGSVVSAESVDQDATPASPLVRIEVILNWKDRNGRNCRVLVAYLRETAHRPERKEYVVEVFPGEGERGTLDNEVEVRKAELTKDFSEIEDQQMEAACESIFRKLKYRRLIADTQQNYISIINAYSGLVKTYVAPIENIAFWANRWGPYYDTFYSRRGTSVSGQSGNDGQTVPQPGSGRSIDLSDLPHLSFPLTGQPSTIDISDIAFTCRSYLGDPHV